MGLFKKKSGHKKGCCNIEIIEEPTCCGGEKHSEPMKANVQECGCSKQQTPKKEESGNCGCGCSENSEDSDKHILRILGTGCKKCNTLEENTKEAVKSMDDDFKVLKVTDINEIARLGAMTTPALMVGDKIVSAGKVLTPEQIKVIVEKTI